MEFGLIGLGHMGLALAQNAQDKGHRVIAWNRSTEKREAARAAGIEVVDSVHEVVTKLPTEQPWVVWLMVAAGNAVDEVLFAEGGLASQLREGDIVIDGANSHFQASQARAAKLAEKGIRLLDVGVSGGISGARSGATIMVGGEQAAVTYCEQLFKDLAVTEGYVYCGASGLGHFVKMVHNAIEYGMMQSLAEGLDMLTQADQQLDLPAITRAWNHGSIIESKLVGYLNQALTQDPQLAQTSPEVGSLGTGKWAVEYALQKGIPLTSIAHAVFSRYQSTHPTGFAYRVLQALRSQFGNHTSSDRPV